MEAFNKACCRETIKRTLKKASMIWKRMRNSLKHERDGVLFGFFKQELGQLTDLASNGKIDLCYFDETGLNLNPNVPYAWQMKGSTAQLPATRGEGISILGILNPLKNSFIGNIYEGAANADCVIQTLDGFSKQLERKTILILDNATIHKARKVSEYHQVWKDRGLFLQFIPAYCPELNLIEILWRRLKHSWIRPTAYTSMETLKKATINILQNYGRQYSITFV